MSTINFADFLIFTGAQEVDEASYAVIAAGVLEHIKAAYAIHLEPATLTSDVFLTSPDRSFYLPGPVRALTSITYDGTLLVDEADYTYYGEDVLMTSGLLNYRKPLVVVMDVGYLEGEVPSDLRLALYRHIEATFFAIKNRTDNIGKTLNSTGNTTYFVNDAIPQPVQNVYDFYTNRVLAMV